MPSIELLYAAILFVGLGVAVVAWAVGRVEETLYRIEAKLDAEREGKGCLTKD